MNPIPPSGCFTPLRAAAAISLVLSAAPVATASTPYTVETHGPRIGTRIVNFFKDLAYGENPNNRYRGYPKQQPVTPQQYNYGARPGSGQRYALDAPPPSSGYPQRIPSQAAPVMRTATPPPMQRPASDDMPYATTEAREPVLDDTPQAGIGGQREDLPPVTIKSKNANTLAQPAKTPALPPASVAQKKPAETIPPSKPETKSSPPADVKPASPGPTEVASGSLAAAASKSWQSIPTENAAAKPPTSAFSNAASPPAPVETSATLTGSRTGKDGRVKSPYPPHNELDVTGLPSGSLAMDPTTGKVFRVP